MDNKLSMQFYFDASTAAKGSKSKTTPSTSFAAYRMFAKSINAALLSDRQTMEKEIAELNKTYNAKVVGEKKLEMENIYKDTVTGKQAFLTTILNKLADNVRKSVEKYAMIPPRTEKIAMIETAEKRIDSMSETEFVMLVKNCNDNYQESALLHDIAEKHGKGYDLPFEPEEANKTLDLLVPLLKERVIGNIDKDPIENMEMANFFRHEEGKEIYGQINTYAEYFDSLPIAIEEDNPTPELTNKEDLVSRLLTARQVCWKHDAKALWEEAVHANLDIQNNGLTSENITKAEKIIAIANEMFPGEGKEGKDNA